MTQNIAPGSVDYSDDPILPPWYVPGWTAQNAEQAQFAIQSNTANLLAPGALPNTFSYVQATATFSDGNNNQIGGYLTFEQSQDLLIEDMSGNFFRVPRRLVGNIPTANLLAWNAEGSGKVYIQFGIMNVILLATDQPNAASVQILEPYHETQEAGFVAPTTWVYHVKEYFMGGMRYDISVPSVLSPGPVDISTLMVAGTLEHNHDWNRGY